MVTDPELDEAERRVREVSLEYRDRRAIERVMAEYDRLRAESARSRAVVEAAEVVAAFRPQQIPALFASALDNLAAAVRAHREGDAG